jgi:DNA-binding transcriptional ArsR family regulator
MQGDEIREQIEALREEVRGLSTSILNLRQDDMRKVFGDQIKPVLVDRIVRHYSRAGGQPTGKVADVEQKARLMDLVDRCITVFQHEGRQKALLFLDEMEKGGLPESSRNTAGMDEFESQTIAQLREYLMLSEYIFNQNVPDNPQPSGQGVSRRALVPEQAERWLAPLSNARRVQVMLILSRESDSLAELSKLLDLKKGHLQFHLKALLDVDYIRFDRKSRLYSISPRGTQVLDGVAKLVDGLSSM